MRQNTIMLLFQTCCSIFVSSLYSGLWAMGYGLWAISYELRFTKS